MTASASRWPAKVRAAIEERDPSCVGRIVGFPTRCYGAAQLDHIRASGGIGMKSPSTLENGARLCFSCHEWKTSHGREARPLLLDYVNRVTPGASVEPQT